MILFVLEPFTIFSALYICVIVVTVTSCYNPNLKSKIK